VQCRELQCARHTLFETIDRIDWRALDDAYWPSVGTARRIRDLALPSQATREQACRDLG
jgi:hypothetical protein